MFRYLWSSSVNVTAKVSNVFIPTKVISRKISYFALQTFRFRQPDFYCKALNVQGAVALELLNLFSRLSRSSLFVRGKGRNQDGVAVRAGVRLLVVDHRRAGLGRRRHCRLALCRLQRSLPQDRGPH